MKTNKIILGAALAFTFALSACGIVDGEEGDTNPPNEAVSQSLVSFSFDSTAIATKPAALMPVRPLTLDRLSEVNTTRALLQSAETPTRAEAIEGRVMYKTSGWELEVDSKLGRVTSYSLAAPGLPTLQDEAKLRLDSLSRLSSFGVGAEEIGKVLQRRSMSMDMDGTSRPTAPRLHSYKTFVFRAINGIPVRGHRAVVSHGPDGKARKVLVTWPALAKSGHLLRTALTTQQIEGRASEALAESGETSGKASLSWSYVPVPLTSGEVMLKLVAVAKIDGAVDADGTTEEPRFVDVDVSAQ